MTSARMTWSGASRRGRCSCCMRQIDSVTPTEQSIELFKRAGQPTELHLISDVDHFMFAESNARVWDLVRGWLAGYFPAKQPVARAAKAATGQSP